jgi:Zn finger protein HypA/HybF involved in hydrogenase expression
MFVSSIVRRALRVTLVLLGVGLGAGGAAGCNQLLLSSSQSASPADGGPAVGAALTRESHAVYFPIADGTMHSAQVCEDCHQSADTFADFTCISCHDHSADLAATRHIYITDFAYVSSACFSCHPTGNEAAITVDEHSLKYFQINDSAHGALACSDCHLDPTTSKPFTCITCHDHGSDAEQANHVNVSGYSYSSDACFSCHAVVTD